MIDYISQDELAALSVGELRLKLTQIFNALATHQRTLAECADLTEAMQAVRQEIRRRALKM